MLIQDMRKRKGITQAEFAAAMGVCQSAVAQWETGARTPLAARIPKIAEVLDCTLDELYGRSDRRCVRLEDWTREE